jgi:serine protease SohB
MERSSLLENGDTTNKNALYNNTVIIIDIKPDARVGNGMAEHLRDTVSFIIEQHRDHLDRRRSHFYETHKHHTPSTITRTAKGIRSAIGTHLEILLLLDSPGGTVADYGLASSHLHRLRNEPRITLSICVDRIAASGGYMMACQASPGRLFAAPFAMVGSIGVLMETVNFHDLLTKYGIKPLTVKAGKYKAPLKSLGEVSREEMEYAQKDADSIHDAFRQLVVSRRPDIVANKEWMDKVCTGSVFLGRDAVDLGLVDRVMTSDEYVAERIAAGDRVLRLIPYKGPQFGLKLSPLDLLLSGMDAEGRGKIWEVVRGVCGAVASLCRVGGAVGILNGVHHVVSLSLRSGMWTGGGCC